MLRRRCEVQVLPTERITFFVKFKTFERLNDMEPRSENTRFTLIKIVTGTEKVYFLI